MLGHLADIDLRIEVGSEGLVVVAGIAVNDVQVGNLVEVVLSGIGCVDAADTGIKSAAEDGGETSLPEAILIRPLPAVLILRFVLGLVVGGVEVIDATAEAGIHDGEVLVREGDIDHQLGLYALHEYAELLHIVCIDLSGLDEVLAAGDLSDEGIHGALRPASDGDVGEDVPIHGHLMSHDGTDATGTDDKYASFHIWILLLSVCVTIYRLKGTKNLPVRLRPFASVRRCGEVTAGVLTEVGELPDEVGGDGGKLGAGEEEDGVKSEVAQVRLRHLPLSLHISDGADTTDQHRGSDQASIVGGESLIGGDGDARLIAIELGDLLHPLLGCGVVLLADIDAHEDVQLINDAKGATDEIIVTYREGVKGAGEEADQWLTHQTSSVSRFSTMKSCRSRLLVPM